MKEYKYARDLLNNERTAPVPLGIFQDRLRRLTRLQSEYQNDINYLGIKLLDFAISSTKRDIDRAEDSRKL